MKIKQFLREWRGIRFSDLQIALPPGAPADKIFYDAFYGALAEKHVDENSSWHASKRALGEWIADHVLRPLHAPRILSIGAGEALPELIWLRRGYDVTLNECQDKTLAAARAEFPRAPILIGDAYALNLSGEYQVVTLLTVDYALSDLQLTQTFSNVARFLSPSGILVNYSVNILTIKQLLKEITKAAIGRRNLSASVFWGWSRSPGAIIRIAQAAGLDLKAQHMAKGDAFKPRASWLWRLMPLKNPIILMAFAKNGGAHQ